MKSNHQALLITSGLVVAFTLLILVACLPAIAGLKPAAPIILALLVFTVVLWITEAIDKSIITAKYNQPSLVKIVVISVTQTWSGFRTMNWRFKTTLNNMLRHC